MLDYVTGLVLLVLIIVTIINFVLTVAVYRSDPQSDTNKIFSILGINLSIWAIAQYISLQPFSPQVSLAWVRFSTFLAVPITPLFFLLAYVLPNKKIMISKWKLFSLILLTFLVMIITVSPFAFTKVEIRNSFVTPTPGPAILIFSLFVVGTAIALFYTFITKLRKLQGSQKRQLIFVGIGIILMLGMMIGTVVIPVTVFQNATLVPLFPVYTLFFTGLAAYAIVRHRLFDVRVITTEAITAVLWVVLFAKLFVNKNISESILDGVVLLTTIVFGILLIRSVIREIKQREQLQELTEKLRAMDVQKDTFISMAAHELRSPLTAIKGYTSMILEGDTGDIPEKTRGFLADVNSINERLIRLVNNMLDVSRIEEGRMVYQLEVENLSRIVQSVFGLFVPEAERKNLTFKLNIQKNLKDRIYVDVDKVNELISNIISNAIKYTDKGSVIVNLKQTSQEFVRFEVVDTGPGITKPEQEKLFQKFYRAESNVGKTTGTGLGLYICRLLVEKFNGKIGVDSEPGQGSTFWFELPVYTDGKPMDVYN